MSCCNPLNRRAFLKSSLGTAALTFLAQQARAATPPNILFLAADDMNDWIGCLGGHPQGYTPNIDALARRGMLFADAHTAAPVCGPSRAALLSGLAPHRTECYSNNDSFDKRTAGHELLPQYFERHGYRTFGAGKIMHGPVTKYPDIFQENGPGYDGHSPLTDAETQITDEDFAADTPWVQHRVERLGVTLPLNNMPRDRNRDSRKAETFDWGPFDVDDDAMSDTRVANWGIDILKRRHVAPFFLGLGFFRPHQPLFAPRKYFDRFPPESVVLPEVPPDDLDDLGTVGRDFARRAITSGLHETVITYNQWRNAVCAYLACLSFVDALVGRVIEALDASPYAENTAIVFWGDHGWHLGEKEHWGKFTGWSSATRVPLIVVPPKNAGYPAGQVCEQPVSLQDLFPTLTKLAGIPPKSGADGDSLVPLLRDPRAAWRDATVTVFGRGNHSVRMPGWRYIRYYDGTEELYDTTADPNEWRNLAARPEYAEIKERAAGYIPRMENIAHYVRVGNTWKAVLPAGTSDPLLYDLAREDYVGEGNDVARDHPEVIAAIRKYIADHGITDQYVSIPDVKV